MEIKTLQVGPLETNCYILKSGNDAVVIDPGGDAEIIIESIEKDDLKVVHVLNTHGHHDHVLANSEISKYAGQAVKIYPEDAYMLSADQGIFPILSAEKDYPTEDLTDGQKIDFGGTEIEVFHTPGHTKGSVCFLAAGNLFCGDLLFKQSIGRTDLDGSSPEDMVHSLKKVMKLSKEYVVYPGHGGTTTIADEVRDNPFILELNI